MTKTLAAHVVIALAVLPAGATAARGAALATDGKPQMTIVLAEGAIPAERTAATELADYLAKVTGGKFAVVGEAAAPPGPGLYVGPTALARKQGLDPSTWADRKSVV